MQGKTYTELVECYKFMNANADKIAISFDYSYYNITGLGKTKEARWANGRPGLIDNLMRDGVWNTKKEHHLLGASLVVEFASYARYWDSIGIATLDTSNPVQQGLLGHNYAEYGLLYKDRTKVADSFETVYSTEQLQAADTNVKIFKDICKCDNVTILGSKFNKAMEKYNG